MKKMSISKISSIFSKRKTAGSSLNTTAWKGISANMKRWSKVRSLASKMQWLVTRTLTMVTVDLAITRPAIRWVLGKWQR